MGGYSIPTLGVFDSFDEIDFSALPERFIIKTTFGSGDYYICKDKSRFDIDACRRRTLKSWNGDYYWKSREWPYKGLKKRIIIEPLLDDGRGDYLTDYKFFTFNGEPKFYYVTSNRGKTGGINEDFFDIQGNLLPFNQEGYSNNPITPHPPIRLREMVGLARLLAVNTYHLRVDFYEVNDVIYVGELTFFDGGGFHPFTPNEWNLKLGDWIKLPID